MEVLFSVGGPLVLLITGYVVGKSLEKKHFKLLMAGEESNPEVILMTVEDYPEEWEVRECGVIIGSVVISLDYYKRVVSIVRALIGGSLREYEPLLARARREALLRMKNEAVGRGYDHVVNVRLETARLASSRGEGKGTVGVEIVAYGTGLKLG